jgi:crossover junction endodeoxyribonuclease RusA
MKVSLELPEPPSTNRYWRVGRGRTYLSPEAQGYKAAVLLRATKAGYRLGGLFPFPAGKPIIVTLEWYRSRRSGDLDNRAKVALDALNRVLWADDDQIVELHLYRHDRPKNGALLITVEDWKQ